MHTRNFLRLRLDLRNLFLDGCHPLFLQTSPFPRVNDHLHHVINAAWIIFSQLSKQSHFFTFFHFIFFLFFKRWRQVAPIHLHSQKGSLIHDFVFLITLIREDQLLYPLNYYIFFSFFLLSSALQKLFTILAAL